MLSRDEVGLSFLVVRRKVGVERVIMSLRVKHRAVQSVIIIFQRRRAVASGSKYLKLV